MAKNSVPEWDTNPDNNTDVGGVDIRQPANGSNIGYGLREVMAQIKEWTTGASFTGVTTFSNVYVSSSAPSLRLIETDAATDEKITRFIMVDGDLFLQSMTDAGAGGVSVLAVRRDSATAWSRVELNVPLVLNTGGSIPMIAFDSDLDTGIYQAVENQLVFMTGNSNRLIIDNDLVRILRPTEITGDTEITGNTVINGTLTVTG